MKSFEELNKKGLVLKRVPDKALAKSLIISGIDRLQKAEEKFKPIPSEAKYLLEGSYEALKELAEAELALQGYKSYSHEAAISYLTRFKEIQIEDLKNFDKLRVKRNGVKYYGKNASAEEAEFSLEFAKKFIIKLKLLLEKQLGDK